MAMQPVERRTRLKHATLARGRMFLKAELGWLPGFPEKTKNNTVVWNAVPRTGDRSPYAIELDREKLQRAVYTQRKLVHRFPRVLPRMVDDVAWWKEGTGTIFEWLKNGIHKNRPLPKSLLDEDNRFSRTAINHARGLVAAEPRLRQFVESLSWVHYLHPSDFTKAVNWTLKNKRSIDVLLGEASSVIPVHTLCELARRDGPGRVQSLVDTIGDPRIHDCPSLRPVSFVRELITGSEHKKKIWRQPKLAEEYGRRLIAFSLWIFRQDRGVRARALDLFALLFPIAGLERWDDWWRRATDTARRLERIDRKNHRLVNELYREVNRLKRDVPRKIDLSKTLDRIQYAAAPTRVPLYKSMSRALQQIPPVVDGSLARSAFLFHFLQRGEAQPSEMRFLLGEFRKYLGIHKIRRLAPWGRILETWEEDRACWWSLFHVLLEATSTRATWKRAFTALAAGSDKNQKPLTSIEGEWLIYLTHSLGSSQAATERFMALTPKLRRDEPENDFIQLAVAIARDGKEHVQLYEALTKFGDLESEDHQGMLRLNDLLKKANWPDVLCEVVLDGRINDLVPLLRLVQLLDALQRSFVLKPAPDTVSSPRWARGYPAPVRRCLAMLHHVSEDGESKANRLLKSVFPAREQIESELRVLRSRAKANPDNERLSVRIKHLEQRRTGGVTPSQAVIRKTVERLDRAVRESILNACKADMELTAAKALQSVLNTKRDVSLLLAHPHVAGVADSLSLKGEKKKLAIRLYCLRCEPAPWHLDDDPANQRFIKRMKRRGIDMSPWLEESEPRSWQSGSRTLKLAFAADPLDVFQMGAPFDTCLSPGDCNFFSVFANAADVNKRVLIAWDNRERIVARCLFALSDDGGILLFHPYSHENGRSFRSQVTQVAAELAQEMGTSVIPRGRVSTLVSSDWYDDGPRDLCDQFKGLRAPAFQEALNNATPACARSLIEGALAPLPINELTIPHVLDLDAFLERPELVLAIREDLMNADRLRTEVVCRAALAFHSIDEKQVARFLIQRRLAPLIRQRSRRYELIDAGLMLPLTEIDPSFALRVVRATRDPWVRKDRDETMGYRIEVLKQALSALGRHKQAEALKD